MNTLISRIAPLVALLGLLLLAGCQTVRYEYYPPTSDNGRYCVTQCSAIRESCEGNEANRASMEKVACERQKDHEYRECRARAGGNRDKEKECDKNRGSCWISPNNARCETNYRECYVNCGGRIVKIVEDM